MFAIQTQREWRRFCAQVMEAPALADDARFATNADRLANRAELEAIIEERFRAMARARRASTLLERADIPTGAVNDVPCRGGAPATRGARTLGDGDIAGGRHSGARSRRTICRARPRAWDAVPALGEHTAEVLSELR